MTNFIIKFFLKDRNGTNARYREKCGKLASIVGIATNILLFLIKIVAGFIFHSISITADAINNLSDSASSVVTFMGFKISGKPADDEHPYGHARMEYVAGLILSLTILFLGLQLTVSSVNRILHPKKTIFTAVAFAVLIISILIKLWQSLFYKKIGKMINSTTLFAASSDSLSDVLSTLSVLIGAIVSKITGLNLDGYLGVIVAVIIIFSGIRLIAGTISLLLGEAPTKEMVDKIYKKILSYDHIMGLHDLTVHSYGEGKCYASVHCEVSAEQDIMASHDLIDKIERAFMRDEGIHLVIHLDPVNTSDKRTNELKSRVNVILNNISRDISMHDFRVLG